MAGVPETLNVTIKLDLPTFDAVALAKLAYAAYGRATGGQTHDSKPLPTWDELGLTIQSAWAAAAAEAAVAAFKAHGYLSPTSGRRDELAEQGFERVDLGGAG